MSEAYKKLIKTLQTLFEMEKGDLDFGIYRIMNQKRDEISAFLESDLLSQVKQAFADFTDSSQADLKQELQAAIEQARKFGAPDPENTEAVLEIKQKMASAVDITTVENEVFSHLHTFFSRYYDKGDFISQRRYKKDTYAIPYEGEEVKLYWANYDQYYIKSSEHLRDYAFTVNDGERNIRIKLVEADTEKDNVKAESGMERRFILDADNPLSVENDELHIHFHYKPVGKKKQTALNEEAVQTIFAQQGFDDWLALLKTPAPTEKNPNRTLLEKHLNDYTARNTFDYFIHKDLGGFLRRELDFYIKNEVLYLDDIDDAACEVTETHLRKIKVIRTIAHKIIRMLAQLEDFQKKLWLKKKFVVETNYCMTLDRVPEDLYGEILANTAQHEEWIKLGFTTEDTEITEEYLKENPFLVLDTRFFDEAFKDKLLASIENLDEQCDGLLIKSENFDALSLLQVRYKNKIALIYIDPPYNTGDDGFSYKDSYKHSSWMTMMNNRISISLIYLSHDALFSTSIDRDENHNLLPLLFQIFGETGFIEETVWQKAYGGGSKTKHINNLHEYVHIFCRNKSDVPFLELPPSKEALKYYKLEDEKVDTRGKYRLQPLNTNSNDYRENLTFPLPIPSYDYYGTDKWDQKYQQIRELLRKNAIQLTKLKHQGGKVRWQFTTDKGEEWGGNLLFPPRQWQWSWEKVRIAIINNELSIEKTNGDWSVNYKQYRFDNNGNERGSKPSSINIGPYTQTGTKEIRNLFGCDAIKFPKPVGLLLNIIGIGYKRNNTVVMDYFAGSGTTGEAIITLNREDNGQRKYILVEMGEYFDTVLKPRIQKVVYSKEWKDGKPNPDNDDNLNGISHCFKYLRLESYEDTLNNLILKPRTEQQDDLLKSTPALREDYMLGYWLDVETADSPSLLNIEQFEDPFNYQLNIATGSVGATKLTRVDLVETFNYLIGLTVKHIDTVRGFRVVTGTNPKDESVLVIWRNLKEKDNAALEEFMEKQAYHPCDTEFDHIYVNGDHTLEDPHSKVKMIEIEFKRLMFDVRDV